MADEPSQNEQFEALSEENESLSDENEVLSDESEVLTDEYVGLTDKKYYLGGAFPIEKAALIPMLRDACININWNNTRKATLVRLQSRPKGFRDANPTRLPT